jgi:hypothetical protein
MDYVTKCPKSNYGMTYKQIRQLAYDYGRRLRCKFPSSWTDNRIVVFDWLQGCMKRHKNLTLHSPEYTSLFRTTAFNKTNVMEFFDSYERALKSFISFICIPSIHTRLDNQGYGTSHMSKAILK